jgi:hypothetical protein
MNSDVNVLLTLLFAVTLTLLIWNERFSNTGSPGEVSVVCSETPTPVNASVIDFSLVVDKPFVNVTFNVADSVLSITFCNSLLSTIAALNLPVISNIFLNPPAALGLFNVYSNSEFVLNVISKSCICATVLPDVGDNNCACAKVYGNSTPSVTVPAV